jgi:hypothetical protein
MGFFPFLAPFSPWIKQIMEDREADPKKSMLQKQPFAILTSAALVVKGDKDVFSSNTETRKNSVKTLISNPPSNSHKGCIIASNIHDISLSYSTGKTPVGIDFTGKVIEVEGESGRRVSTPIIESIDIDTDGANNTLKTAKVTVRCFTLKQLEMFELFFMKPGMNVLLEFGDSTLKYMDGFKKNAQPNQTVTKDNKTYRIYQNGEVKELTVYDSIEKALVPKKDYDNFCKEEFYKYFRSDRTGQIDYINRVEASLGSFDLVAGKVTDYSFSIDADGTYNVNIEISQGNQITLAIPHSVPTEKSKTQTQPKDLEFTPVDQIKELILADFNLDSFLFDDLLKKYEPEHGGAWDLDWFNFLKVNKEQQDTVASSDAYISLRFILKILMNYILADKNVDENFFQLVIKKYKILGTDEEIEIIPVTSHKSMLSSSDQIIFPRNNIPKVEGPTDGNKNQVNEETYNLNSNIDGRIGKKLDFHFDKDLFVTIPGVKDKEIRKDFGNSNEDFVLGNALNIFIKYETVVKNWKSTYTRIDFLEKILNVVNQHGYGLYNLIFGVTEENGKPSVFDHRFAPEKVIQQTEVESYRFKPTTINSIVKEFSFNFEMSNLVAGRTVFNSGKFLALAKQEKEKNTQGSNGAPTDPNAPSPKNQELELPAAAYKAIDNSTFGNADGWYSINNVELKRIEENFKKAKDAEEKKSKVQTEENKTEDTTKEAKNISEVIKTKSINFLIDEDSVKGRNVVLIYKDPAFIRDKINKKEKDLNKPTVSPITVTITVDGFSGFRCGQYFNVDGIPEIYNQIGVFQITNTKHNVSKDGWTTTIEADHRIITKAEDKTTTQKKLSNNV